MLKNGIANCKAVLRALPFRTFHLVCFEIIWRGLLPSCVDGIIGSLIYSFIKSNLHLSLDHIGSYIKFPRVVHDTIAILKRGSFASHKNSCKKLELVRSPSKDDSGSPAATKFRIFFSGLSANNKFYVPQLWRKASIQLLSTSSCSRR